MPDRAPGPATPTRPSQNGTDPGPPATAAPAQQLAISGVVLDRAQMLAALRAALPNATGIAPIDNGAYYAVLMAPAAPAAPTLPPVASA